MLFFSVIMPCYNIAHYLRHCLDSIFQNDFYNMELILVNDGSTDNFAEVINAYFDIQIGASDVRFVYKSTSVSVLQLENGGVSSARNRGLENATGEYIIFVDPDDYISSHYFMTVYEHLSKEQSDMVLVGFTQCCEDAAGNVVSCKKILPNVCYCLEDRKQVINQLLPRYLGYSVSDLQQYGCRTSLLSANKELGYVWRCIYSRKFLTENGIKFNEKVSVNEDGLFNMHCCMKANRLSTIMDYFYYYTIRPSGAFLKRYDKWLIHNKLELLAARSEIVENLQNEGVDIGLDSFAGSVILSAIEIMKESTWKNACIYLKHPVTQKAIHLMPFIGNLKFDISLAFLKGRLGAVLFGAIHITKKLGIPIGM